MEIQMQQAADVIDFEAAHFTRLAMDFGSDLPAVSDGRDGLLANRPCAFK